MAARYGLQPRSYRRFPRRDRGGAGQDEIRFDENKSRVEQVLEILENVCVKAGVTDSKKLQYLSALVRLLSAVNPRDGTTDLGLRIKEILLCLRIPLLSDNGDLRTATLRSVRYLIKNQQDVSSVIAVNLHLLVIRIIDLDSDNRNERLQAVKLVKQLLMHGPQCFPSTLVKCLISLTQKGEKRKENFRRPGLALLCQLSCLNPSLFVYTGCVRYVCQVILSQDLAPSIIESVIGCLLRLFNIPWFREECGLDLSCLVGPFTELRLRGDYTWGNSEDARKDQQQAQIRLNGASTALLSVLRSWSGILHINNPTLCTKPIQSLVQVLTTHNLQSRKMAHGTRILVLDIIFKSLNLQVPDWTEEFDVAMQTLDPSDPKDSWKLSEGFAAAEGRDIFPHLSKSRPNLVENHVCLLLSCYLECKLPSALVDVITSSDTVLSVRATVLLGQLMHLVTKLLPREIGAIELCLPELAGYISVESLDHEKQKSARAAGAVSALQRLHAIKKLGPRPQSLLLQQAVHFSGHTTGEGFVGDKLLLPAPTPSSAPLTQSTSVAIENATMASVKESQVIPNRDPQSWKWEAVMSVLRWPSDGLKRLEDSNYKIFTKKLTDYFKPSSNMFSLLELATQRTREHARIGVCLVDFLVSSIMLNSETAELKRGGAGVEHESGVYLDELLVDIFVCVKEVIDSTSAHNCLFSPTRISNTACQLYFLFVGRLTSTEQGRLILDKHDARSLLQSLLASRMDVYLKLVVTCIDYRSVDWRMILSKAISGHSEAGRLYTIRWLGVLARMGAPSFSQYGIELLVDQLKDSSLQVSVAALTVLEEVSDDKMYLEALVAAKSSLLSESGLNALHKFGSRGRVLLTRFLGSGSGFSVMVSTDWLKSELAHWAESFNKKYVIMVEGLLNDCLTQHQRSLDGFGVYGRRSGDQGKEVRDAYIPPHLYGQLAQTSDGLDVLLREHSYLKMIDTLREVEMTNFAESKPVRAGLLAPADSRYIGMEELWLQYKAAIWGVTSVASSSLGIIHLEKQGIINTLVNIAETCQIISLKGTAYFALGQVATTKAGATALGIRGWASVRHSRSDVWPIAFDWWESPEDCILEQQENITDPGTIEAESDLDYSWIVEDKPNILVEESRVMESRESSTKKQRRKKNVSECTEDSIMSQSILEIGPSPTEPPSFPLQGKLTEKISNWFSGSSNGTSTTKSEPRNSGGSRRFSDGGKLGSSIAKIRNSFRRRSKTLSSGCTPPEGTPVSSIVGEARTSGFDEDGGSVGGGARKSSFSQEDGSSGAGGGGAGAGGIPASPDTMPGEIFSMEKILEEPSSQSTPNQQGTNIRYTKKYEEEAQCRVPDIVKRRLVSESHEGNDSESQSSSKLNFVLDTTRSSSQVGKDLPDISGDQMDTSITSTTSIMDTGSKDTSRNEGTSTIAFSAIKHDVYSNMKPGTSASSVSSYGSYGQRGYYDPYGLGSLARPRVKRRPQLSESEDGDNSVVSVSGHVTTLSRQDSKTWSLDYKLLRNTNTAINKRLSVIEPNRMLPIPSRPYIHISRPDTKEPAYWGLTFPLNPSVLYPQPINAKPSSPRTLDLPVMVGAWLNSSPRHSQTTCLSCCRLQPSARPRAASLSITKEDLRASLLVTGSLPSSQQSPEVKRKSWNPSLTSSNNHMADSNNKMQADSSDPHINLESARAEAMEYICQLNSLRVREAESGLNRLRGKAPKLFQDLCFYSDVSSLLGEYDYKANARKFIHQLFTPVIITQMEMEAQNVINPAPAGAPAPPASTN